MTSYAVRTTRAAAALLLGCGGLLVVAAPAGALAAWGIDSPGPGARLVGPEPVPVVAYVDHAGAEEVQRVEVRFTWGGAPVGVVRRLDLLDTHEVRPGVQRSRFSAVLNPMSAAWFDFRPAPNGRYQLHARVQYAVQGVSQDPTPWSAGQDLVVDVPPPRPGADAALTDPATRTVTVSWDRAPAGMADFTRYVVERAGIDGAYRTVHESFDAAATRATDTAPGDGEYRYRVTTYRAGAEGGERASPPGDTRAVYVRTDAAPAPAPGEDAGTDPQPPGTPGEGGGAEATAEGAPRAGSSWRPWVFPSRPPRSAPRPPAVQGPRAAPPPEDTTFSELLDYGERPDEWEVTERRLEPVVPRGGTLTIFDRDLDTEQILVPFAAGLVLVLTGLHLRRFLNP